MAGPEEDPEQANVEEEPEEEDREEDSEEEPAEAVEEFLLAQLTVHHHANTQFVQQSLSGKPMAKISSPTATPSTRNAAEMASPTTASPAKKPVAKSPHPKISSASPATATPVAKSRGSATPSKRKAAKEAPAEAHGKGAKAAAKGAASSSRNVFKAKPAASELVFEGSPHDVEEEQAKKEQGSPHDSKEEQGSPHDSKEKQGSPHDCEEEATTPPRRRATTPPSKRVRTGYDTATPTGYDTEPGAASRAEDGAEEEADPQNKPAAKVTVTIAGAGAKDDIVQELPDFVLGLPSHLHPPQKLKEGAKNYTLSSRSQSTKITVRMGQRMFYAKPVTAGQVKLLDALELSQDNQGGVSISVGKLGLKKSVELVTELLEH